MSQATNAQSVFEVPIRHLANKRVFVTDKKSEANMLVYKVPYAHESNPAKGLWHFTPTWRPNCLKIYFVKHKHEADLVIFYVPFRHQATAQIDL